METRTLTIPDAPLRWEKQKTTTTKKDKTKNEKDKKSGNGDKDVDHSRCSSQAGESTTNNKSFENMSFFTNNKDDDSNSSIPQILQACVSRPIYIG